MSNNDFELSPVKFSRLARRGVILGLSLPQLIALGFGAAVVVVALYAGGSRLLLYTVPLWAGSAAAAWVPISGRKAVEWAPVAGHWLLRMFFRQTIFRRHVVRPRPVGTLALPGDAASLREYDDPETGAAMIHDPHRKTLTAILTVTHPAFILLDPAAQEHRVTSWGRVLASCCRSGRIARLQVLERSLPDSGADLSQWWAEHAADDDSWPARTYRELIHRAGPAGERHATTLSLALDMKTAARTIHTAGGGLRGAAAVLRQEMETLAAAVRSADLKPGGWLTPGDLAVALRSAYDPAIAGTLDRAGDIGRDLANGGPVAVDESWDRLRTDSAHHTVLWISEWPRSLVYPGFLAPILLSTGIRRAFSLVCTPIRSDEASRDIRRKKTEYLSDATQRARIGQIEDAQQTAEYQDVLKQEADLTAGHGVLRYTGLISLSAPSVDELEAAVSAIEQAAIQASCETRRLVGQQAQAFAAAALPLARAI